MTYQTNCTLPEEILEQIAEEGRDEIPQMIRLFFESLVERGLQGVQLIISDDHQGLCKARQAEFTGISW